MRDLVSSDLPASSAHEDGLWAAMISAPDSEKRQAWQKYSSDSDVQRAHERAKLAALFGGRVRYIAGEYVRLGLLSESDLSLLEWQIGSLGWTTEAANTLESVALRL